MSEFNAAEFEEYLKWKASRDLHKRTDGPDPAHRGVIDMGYARPAPLEFPKMAYRTSKRDKAGYQTRVIESQEEQDSVVKQGWLVAPKDIHALLEKIEKERNGALAEVAVA